MGKTLKTFLLMILFFAVVLAAVFIFIGKDQSFTEIREEKTIRIGYAVEAGNADALALSTPAIQWMALNQQLGKTEMAQTFEQNTRDSDEFSGYGAFAFRKDDIQLLNEWNAALKDFIQTEDYKKMIAEFGFTEQELPGNISTAEVLKK